jgi:kynureninase
MSETKRSANKDRADWTARDTALGERIAELVSAMGEFIAEAKKARN